MDSRLETLLQDAIKRTRAEIDELAKGREPKRVRAELVTEQLPREDGAAVAGEATPAASIVNLSEVDDPVVILPLLPLGAVIPPSASKRGSDTVGDE